MSNSFALEVFAEDAAHEAFLLPFVKRLAVEEGASVEVRVRSAVGGHGRALSEFDLFQKTLSQRLSATPDLVVVCIDANCKRHNQAHRDIADRVTPALCECTIIACPDPHIERWYMADSEGFALAVGATPATRKRKCGRDSYKALLRNTIRQAGLLAPLGGIEFASELVQQMDLFRAGKSDRSLKAFTDELKSALTRLISSRSTL
jgi:predicted MPP superfamily phosphohydrolase